MFKIATYTICKNELNHVEKWYDSVKQADEIYILDTGSTDGTLEKLKELQKENEHFHLYEKSYEHFSFGDAWNTIIEKIPDTIDFIFRLDLDQYILNHYWYFEMQLFFLAKKIDPKKSISIHASMFEKNFSRIESHFFISSRNARWAGDIHERDYFPGVPQSEILGFSCPLVVFHNQKYPSTSGTGIPGCQKRFDFYADIARHQYVANNTVFNFIHALMAHSDMNEIVNEFFMYLSGNKQFKDCDPLTTYGIDYKPQIIDALTIFLGLITSIRAVDNFYYHQKEYGNISMGSEYPYLSKLFDQLEGFYLHGQTIRENGHPFRDFFQYIEEMKDRLVDYISDIKTEFK